MHKSLCRRIVECGYVILKTTNDFLKAYIESLGIRPDKEW
jgi:hypothetical protein